jgi:hypothetical protein
MADTSLSDPLEPKELGTLIVVVGKAVRVLTLMQAVQVVQSSRDTAWMCRRICLPARGSWCSPAGMDKLTRQRNLPNKSRFGKQDPFCSVRVGDDKKKTKAIKRYVYMSPK